MEHISRQEFDNFLNKSNELEFIKQYRLKSFLKIKENSMPNFKQGLNIVIKPDFDFSTIKPKAKVNNKLSISYEEGVEIYTNNYLSKKDMKKNDEEIIKSFISDNWIDEEDNTKLFYFNQAFTNDFILINIPKNTELTKPIVIEQEINDSPTITSIFILAEDNSKAQILFNKKGNGEYVSENIRILTKNGSKVEFISLQTLDKNTINIQKRKSIMGKDSDVKWIDVCLGAKYTKSSVISNLNGEGANTNNTVLYLATDKQRFDVYTASIHSAPNTTSDILTKGVLNNEAKALSRGLVKIESNAAGSNGYEKQDALLLSEKAEADAIPNLEIHNHDVKCSHGSTVGQLDIDKLFYLMTRGLDKETAKLKIVEGYFTPIIEMFNDNTLKDKVQTSIIKAIES